MNEPTRYAGRIAPRFIRDSDQFAVCSHLLHRRMQDRLEHSLDQARQTGEVLGANPFRLPQVRARANHVIGECALRLQPQASASWADLQ